MDYLTNDTDLKKVADAIRAKGGTSDPLAYPSGFVSEIQAIPSGSAKEEQEKTVTITANGTVEITPDAGKTLSKATAVVNVPTSGGSDDVLDEILTRTISGKYSNDRVTSVGAHAFDACKSLTGVSFPNALSVLTSAFMDCSRITHIDFPIATRIGLSGLRGLTALTSFVLPNVLTLEKYSFYEDSALTTADFHSVSSINAYAFTKCKELTTLIIRRSSSVAQLLNANALNSTPIQDGTGYIYVPSDLVDGYKAATNWATYADQIRAIEDYPDITGGAA